MLPPAAPFGFALFGIVRIVGYVSEPWLGRQAIHRIHGAPARTGPLATPPPARALKVVTWNIERGTRYDRVLQELRDLDADVYLLQEVDRFCRRSGDRDVAKDLADALGLNWVSAGEFQEIGEGGVGGAALTGQAILSRYPITAASVIRFRAQARFRWRFNPGQPRRGGRIALRARAGGAVVYNAHLESRWNRRVRRGQLGEILGDVDGAHDREPVIIAGDFNAAPATQASMFESLERTGFRDVLSEDDRRRSSGRRPHLVDGIFVKNLGTLGGDVVDTGPASDHEPVVATVVPADLADQLRER